MPARPDAFLGLEIAGATHTARRKLGTECEWGRKLGTECEWRENQLRQLGDKHSSGDAHVGGAGNALFSARTGASLILSGYVYRRVVRILAHGESEFSSGDGCV